MKTNLLKNGAVENTAVEDATKFSTYGSEKHKFRNKFVALFVFVFLLGSANGLAQWNGGGTWNDPFQIYDVSDLELLADEIDAGISFQGVYFRVMNDIPGPVTRMIGFPGSCFKGYIWGDNHKITVEIESDEQYVGLFSCLSEGQIYDLVLDGSVIGGLNSQYVGGFAGFVYPASMAFHHCTNLADVTGQSATSTVGGVAGAMTPVNGGSEINPLFNNGTITGGYAIGGIFGTVYLTQSNAIMLIHFKNSGTIKSNDNVDISHYMAGIVAYVANNIAFSGHFIAHNAVNIGKVLSSRAMYSGGILAYINNSSNSLHQAEINNSCNSGVLDGALNASGGIAGYIDNISVISCINTNWIEPVGTAGAIVGVNNNGTIANCFYDNQMCIVGGIGNNPNPNPPGASGLPTASMLGTNLQNQGLPFWGWSFAPNLYPISNDWWWPSSHPISLLAAAPIYLQNNPVTGMPERLDNVTQNFFVSNWNTVAPFLPPPPITSAIPFRYQWGSFDDSAFPWTLIPRSVMGYIDVPASTLLAPSNDAFINGSGSGWDTLSVRVQYWFNIPIPYPMSYEIIFEKVVPINLP